jgi:hypothetical protein
MYMYVLSEFSPIILCIQSLFLATLTTYRQKIPLERLIVFQLVKEVPSLFEFESSLTCLE